MLGAVGAGAASLAALAVQLAVQGHLYSECPLAPCQGLLIPVSSSKKWGLDHRSFSSDVLAAVCAHTA